MIKVKICGLTNRKDAMNAFTYGADFLGFVFIRNTPRYRDDLREIVKDISKEVENSVSRVGLFRNEGIEEIVDTVSYCGLDYVQLQGEETPGYCEDLRNELDDRCNNRIKIIKAIKVKPAEGRLVSTAYAYDEYVHADLFVFDTYHPELPGGTGIKFDEKAVMDERDRIQKRFFMAGGLNPTNVAEVVKKVRPYGVDVSSGVESSVGVKDGNLIKEFIRNAKTKQDPR